MSTPWYKQFWFHKSGESSVEKSTVDDHDSSSSKSGVMLKDDELRNYRFVEDKPLPLEHEFRTLRVAVQTTYDNITDRFGTVQRAVDFSSKTYQSTRNYLREEGSAVPKAVAITVGGLAGFLLGVRRGGYIRQVFYTATGMTVVAAFCYPHETMDIVRTSSRDGSTRLQQLWRDFQNPPAPPGGLPPAEKDLSAKPAGGDQVAKTSIVSWDLAVDLVETLLDVIDEAGEDVGDWDVGGD